MRKARKVTAILGAVAIAVAVASAVSWSVVAGSLRTQQSCATRQPQLVT